MNLLSGPSYEQALNKDDKPGSDKLGSGVRKGIQVHQHGMYFLIKIQGHFCI